MSANICLCICMCFFCFFICFILLWFVFILSLFYHYLGLHNKKEIKKRGIDLVSGELGRIWVEMRGS